MAEYADRKKHGGMGMGASFFQRSNSVHSSSFSSDDKPSYSLMFQRNGSVKKINSPAISSSSSSRKSLHGIGKVKKFRSIFDSQKRSAPLPAPVDRGGVRLHGTEDRVVIFFTSLRGIRRTFQDCHSVRMIFRGFRVNLDERDISLDAAYRRELQDVLGKKDITLPQVFIKGRHVGGADAVHHLLEVGDLAKILRGLPQRSVFKPCDACDDARFIPCTTCNGSRKLFNDDSEDFVTPRRCPDCNENGLLRCPICCY